MARVVRQHPESQAKECDSLIDPTVARPAPDSTHEPRPPKVYAYSRRFPRKESIEVGSEEMAWSMPVREGERLCRSCGIALGILQPDAPLLRLSGLSGRNPKQEPRSFL